MPRLIAIDLARFLAIVGMMAAHLLVPYSDSEWLDVVTSGFPSTLFAVLGGFGVVFSSRKYLREGRVVSALVAVASRGLVVMIIGLLMELLPPHAIAVILVYYGFAIMVGSLLRLLPQLPLLLVALSLAVLGPLALVPLRTHWEALVPAGQLSYSGPWQFVLSVYATGTYPVLTWTVYLALGIVMARFILSHKGPSATVKAALTTGAIGLCAFVIGEGSTRVRIGQISPGLAEMYQLSEGEVAQMLRSSQYGGPFSGGWDAILIGSPHSGSTADILRTAGMSILLISVLLILSAGLKKTPFLLAPIAKAGASPLTVYVLHVSLTAFTYAAFEKFVGFNGLWMTEGGTFPSSFWQFALTYAFWWQLALVLALGTYLALTNGRGPLERVTSAASRLAVRVVGIGSAAGVGSA